MVWTPHVTVAAVIEHAGRYLMVEELDAGGRVAINRPAGHLASHLEEGESLLEAVRREVLEETCREFRTTGLIGVYRWPRPGGDTYPRFCFAGTAGDPVSGCRRDPAIRATRWLSRADLSGGEARLSSPLVPRCIADARRRRPGPLELLHDLA